MVGVIPNTRLIRMILFMLACSIATVSQAQTELDIVVDRNKLYQSELLNMTVTANSEIELSLGGLFNIGGSQVEPPEFEGLEQNWDVIDRQQSYNMRSINGKSSSLITWRYTLSPKRAGNLTIPVAKFKDAQSQALAIEVVAGTPPRDASNPPFVFIQASIDQSEAYVQEQVVYTLTVFSRGQVASGDMSAPSHPDLIIEPVGETVKDYRMAYNQRYETHERKYLIFPQRSGEITIDPQTFTGTVVDSRTRRSQRAREISNSLELSVKAPPSGYSGRTWLPAKALYISEDWDPDKTQITVGDSLTRAIEISALGLLASALPPISQPELNNFKVYPDQPELNSAAHSEGVQSIRAETAAFVAITPGTVSLPAVKIPWWDTVNNVERVAELPERTIEIIAAPQTTNTATPGSSSSLNQSFQAPLEDLGLLNKGVETQANTASSNGDEDESSSPILWPWMLACVLLACGWIAHAYYLISRRSRQPEAAQAKNNSGVKQSYSALLKALDKASPDLSRLTCEWFSEASGESVRSLQELSLYDAALASYLAKFEKLVFNKGAETLDGSAAKKDICADIKRHIKSSSLETKKNLQNSKLEPLYPNS